ncbi:MAG: DUF4920 domain-containing protein [Chitinophagaceae bacterium]|jgi:hypothetical protein|nr:DUF4920 domain-containing protein [Chitinophagaceae bacterium]NMD29583.1 DUF4920 domain-containing protein [Bacteroidota bacterium]HOV44003.1 DUF4920 domain-containing protein [Ferruginibacter sp.]MBK7088978.1 DUF4920 domain-containing protein [Chitinophagaceae bacterium]MBK7089360.1 DUF4920 domain-containing protein [Chitinophagaceae bacterium]
MKKIFFAFIMLVFGLALKAQPPKGDANSGDTYGEKVNAENAIWVSELPTLLENKENITVTIKGKVTDVCSKKGCWITLETADKTKVFVKMKDYGFFVPVAAIGKTVALSGDAKIKNTSVDELKHYAEDAQKSKEEIDAITEPQKEIRFTASGITVLASN